MGAIGWVLTTSLYPQTSSFKTMTLLPSLHQKASSLETMTVGDFLPLTAT